MTSTPEGWSWNGVETQGSKMETQDPRTSRLGQPPLCSCSCRVHPLPWPPGGSGETGCSAHSPAQPPPAPSHKDPGLAGRSEAPGGFQGTHPSTIRAASVFRGASRAELCLQVSSGEAGKHERVASFMAISSLD